MNVEVRRGGGVGRQPPSAPAPAHGPGAVPGARSGPSTGPVAAGAHPPTAPAPPIDPPPPAPAPPASPPTGIILHQHALPADPVTVARGHRGTGLIVAVLVAGGLAGSAWLLLVGLSGAPPVSAAEGSFAVRVFGINRFGFGSAHLAW